jgi:hypothetical protein
VPLHFVSSASLRLTQGMPLRPYLLSFVLFVTFVVTCLCLSWLRLRRARSFVVK